MEGILLQIIVSFLYVSALPKLLGSLPQWNPGHLISSLEHTSSLLPLIAARVLWKCNLDHVILLLKSLQWFSIIHRIKSKILFLSIRAEAFWLLLISPSLKCQLITHSSWKASSSSLPQDLCTCIFLCLFFFKSFCLQLILHVLAQMSFSEVILLQLPNLSPLVLFIFLLSPVFMLCFYSYLIITNIQEVLPICQPLGTCLLSHL